MPTAEAFLEAIIAAPDDDAPRLMYADWLEEQGDAARAEFIRVQIALARMGEEDERREGLRRREQELLKAHRDVWLGDLGSLFPERDPSRPLHQFVVLVRSHFWGGIRFERGMLEGIALPGAALQRHASTLLSAWPIREVWLSAVAPDDVQALATSPWLTRLNALGVGCELNDIDMAQLIASPYLANLQTLRLCRTRSGPQGMAALLHSHLSRLETLVLDGEQLGLAGAEVLASWRHMAGVSRLSMPDNGIGSVGVEALCASENLGPLVSFDVSNNRVSVAGARAIARTEQLVGLQVLELASNPLGNGVEQLAMSPHLRSLRELNLRKTEFGQAGACALARSAIVESLTKLVVSDNYLGPRGAAALAESPLLTSLKWLDLSGNAIGDEGVQALAKSPHLRHVTLLDLSRNALTVFGIHALTHASGLTALRHLVLGGNELDDLAAQVLANWPGLARLKFLSLSRNRISDEGAKGLAASPYVAHTCRLFLEDSYEMTGEGIEALKSAGFSDVTV